MPPKTQYSKETILNCAFEIVKTEGMNALTARSLASKLSCSVKPIFTTFGSMDNLKEAVMKKANEVYESYLFDELNRKNYPPYKATGMAYIRFAKEEKKLFALLFMRDRSKEIVKEDKESIRMEIEMIQKLLSITEEEAYQFHFEMWIFVHGIASMVNTSYLELKEEAISELISHCFQGMCARLGKEVKA